jgi:hypothetical protein
MTEPPEEIIADAPRSPLASRIGAVAAVWGTLAAIVYFRAGLTLSHYDARGHLVVARRVIDSLTPGWLQIGAVWLPLPHLLNMLPVQVDVLYRTGASGVAISIASFALLAYSAARLVTAATGSQFAAVIASALVVSNPNLLYLQSTPMTEPLLLGLCALGITLLYEGLEAQDRRRTRFGFVALALACLTRYEAWPITAGAIAAVVLAEWRRHGHPIAAVRTAATLALIPVVGILWFFVHSKATVGAWFVTGGFYVPDPMYEGKLVTSLGAVWWGIRQLGSETLARVALLSLVGLTALWFAKRGEAALVVTFAWLGAMALPWYAFYQGHPLRIRYMVPSVTAAAVLAGIAMGKLPRTWRVPVAALLLAGVWWQTRPFDSQAAMVLEAQWDRPRSLARHDVTRCLPEPGHGDLVMASMGSLAHYMQELSASGFELRDFLHEGNGALWIAALNGPERYVRWMLIEEVAEGGDMLAARARADPRFLAAFTRVCSGGGVVLYRSRAQFLKTLP